MRSVRDSKATSSPFRGQARILGCMSWMSVQGVGFRVGLGFEFKASVHKVSESGLGLKFRGNRSPGFRFGLDGVVGFRRFRI